LGADFAMQIRTTGSAVLRFARPTRRDMPR
jgi:hypothetical protein